MEIESKDDYKKRVHKSPDCADAFVIMNFMRHYSSAVDKSVDKIKESYDTLEAIMTKQENEVNW
jgi:hypothetical protein